VDEFVQAVTASPPSTVSKEELSAQFETLSAQGVIKPLSDEEQANYTQMLEELKAQGLPSPYQSVDEAFNQLKDSITPGHPGTGIIDLITENEAVPDSSSMGVHTSIAEPSIEPATPVADTQQQANAHYPDFSDHDDPEVMQALYDANLLPEYSRDNAVDIQQKEQDTLLNNNRHTEIV